MWSSSQTGLCSAVKVSCQTRRVFLNCLVTTKTTGFGCEGLKSCAATAVDDLGMERVNGHKSAKCTSMLPIHDRRVTQHTTTLCLPQWTKRVTSIIDSKHCPKGFDGTVVFAHHNGWHNKDCSSGILSEYHCQPSETRLSRRAHIQESIRRSKTHTME